MFIGRKRELQVLNDHFNSDTSEFCVLYGRRRIGKSRLLEEFVRDKRSFSYLAGRETKRLQLKRFVGELGDAVSDPITKKVGVLEWDEALTVLDRNIDALSKLNGGKKAIIIFDEFQWMCQNSLELVSDLQRFWDKKWQKYGKVFLILCGSSISFMLSDVLSQKSPLFGRRTLSFELGSFPISEISQFLPGRNHYELAETYMMLGGIPKYLEILNKKGSFKSMMSKLAFAIEGYFFSEVNFILSQQLSKTEIYFMLLEQLSQGPKEVFLLEKNTGIPSGQIMYYLDRLCLLGFVSRNIPLGKSLTTKKVRYRLDDYYLRFYFTFIYPNIQRINIANQISFSQITSNKWNQYVGYSFEHFVRDNAQIIASKLGFENQIKLVGSFWQNPTKRKPGFQIDLLIECNDNTTFICECKWSRRKTGAAAVSNLLEKIRLYPNLKAHTLVPVLVAAGGVTSGVKKIQRVSVITLDDFFK